MGEGTGPWKALGKGPPPPTNEANMSRVTEAIKATRTSPCAARCGKAINEGDWIVPQGTQGWRHAGCETDHPPFGGVALEVVEGARGFPHHIVKVEPDRDGVSKRRVIATCDHRDDAEAIVHWMQEGLGQETP